VNYKLGICDCHGVENYIVKKHPRLGKLCYEGNEAIQDRGAMGILANNSNDGDGGVPMDAKHKKELRQAYNGKNGAFGIRGNQDNVIITEANVKWTPMAFPTKDMQLFEEVSADFDSLINFYGLNKNMFVNSTFSNVKEAWKAAYQSTIIPEKEDEATAIGEFYGLPDNEKLVVSFEHIHVLQQDKSLKARAANTAADAFKKLTDQGYTQEQAAEITGLPVPEGEVVPPQE